MAQDLLITHTNIRLEKDKSGLIGLDLREGDSEISELRNTPVPEPATLMLLG